MFFFAIVGGTFAWLAFLVLDPTLPEAPNPSDHKTTSENDDIVGTLVQKGDDAWTSSAAKGGALSSVTSSLAFSAKTGRWPFGFCGPTQVPVSKGQCGMGLLVLPLGHHATTAVLRRSEPHLASPLVCAGSVGVRGDHQPFLHGVGRRGGRLVLGGWMDAQVSARIVLPSSAPLFFSHHEKQNAAP